MSTEQELKMENARLKAEVDRLQHQLKLCGEIEVLASVSTGKSILPEIFENENLRAEVERLTNENGNNSVMKEEWYLKCMSARAEVELLRKAGDEMEKVIFLAECIAGVEHTEKSAIAWTAAKEGKPSV